MPSSRAIDHLLADLHVVYSDRFGAAWFWSATVRVGQTAIDVSTPNVTICAPPPTSVRTALDGWVGPGACFDGIL